MSAKRRNELLKLWALPMGCELRADQTIESFVSCLAARNRFGSASELCQAMGFSFQDVLRGDEAALIDVATIGRLDFDAVRRACFLVSNDRLEIGNEIIRRGDRREVKDRICPACLDEDARADPSLRRDALVYSRSWWNLRSIRTCPTHELELFALPPEVTKPHEHDLAAQLLEMGRLGLELRRDPRQSSRLEHYVVNRMRGMRTAMALLDALPLVEAIELVQLVGAAQVLGRSFRLADLDAESLRTVENTGMQIAIEGSTAIRALLVEMAHRKPADERTACGLVPIYGTLVLSLQRRTGEDHRLLRSLIAEVSFEQMLPRWSATHVAGIELPFRKTLSLAAAAEKYGIDVRVLRQALHTRGAIEATTDGIWQGRLLIDVAENLPLLQTLARSLNLDQAARHIGVDPQQLISFEEAAMIAPAVTRQASDGKPLRHYLPEVLDGFLKRMMANVPEADLNQNLVPLCDAASRVGRPASLVFKLLYEGNREAVFMMSGSKKLDGLVIDVERLRDLVRMAQGDTCGAFDCGQILKLPVITVRELGRAKLLASHMAPNPVNLRPQMTFKRSDVLSFKRDHITYMELAKQAGLRRKDLTQLFERTATKPILPRDPRLTKIYSRADLVRAGLPVAIADTRAELSPSPSGSEAEQAQDTNCPSAWLRLRE